MKKILASVSSLVILLSACSRELPNLVTDLDQTPQQQEIRTLADQEAENTVNKNQTEVSSIAEKLFIENFADDVDKESTTLNQVSSLSANVLSNLDTKGGIIFNTLNKSKFAQKIAYFIADGPVKKWMNKPGKPDSTPRITSDEITQLKASLKAGDLILCGNNASFIHAILYIGDNVIIHSLASKNKEGKFLGVIKETLDEYLTRSERDKFLVLRYKNFDANEFQKSVDFANKQVGKTYDTLFLMNSDTRFYCTELVYQAVMQMNNGPRMYPHKSKFGWKLITNEDFMDSPDFDTVWSLHKVRPEIGKLHQYN